MHFHAAVPRTRFSRRTAEHLRRDLNSSQDHVRVFAAKHHNNPGINLDPLYCLPVELLTCLKAVIPEWLTPVELAFEQDLYRLCQLHHAIGFFLGKPIGHDSLIRPAAPLLSDEFIRQSGWDQYCTPQQSRLQIATALGSSGPLHDRLDAYRGWLMTNPRFLAELTRLKDRWGTVIVQVGHIPPYPVQATEGPCAPPPDNARDITQQFIEDFDNFYDRWDLQRLRTWDLPEPREPNLSGLALPSSVPVAPTTVTLKLPAILPLPTNTQLRDMVENAQNADQREHLRGWFQVRRQQHANDLRFLRLRRTFLLHHYRDVALASRYGDRFAGHVEGLDRAFGKFFGRLGEDSVKKLRVQMKALRCRDS